MALVSMPAVVRLDLAVLTLPDWHPEAANGRSSPVYGYVIDHPGGAIVVDTGVGHDNAFIDEVYEPERQRLDEALGAAGVDPTTVVAVVNSHLHFDHCGQNPMLYGSDVPFYVQGAEVAAVEADRFYTDPTWALPPAAQRQVLEGDQVIAEGVTVLATPGHTLGHQSVLIDAGEERIVIAAQAAWHSSELVDEEPRASNLGSPELRDAALDSLRRLKAMRPQVIHFSHCSALRLDPPAR